VFPGSFDPLTVAHLAVADAVRDQLSVESVHLVISRVALAKEDRDATPAADRLVAIETVAGTGRPWLRTQVTDAQLLVDIAAGYDVLVMGSDKWHQLHDPHFYGGSPAARDDALRRLPHVAVAPRAGAVLPDTDEVTVLRVPPEMLPVSATAVRSGRHEWRA
jgi:hypothetical protein